MALEGQLTFVSTETDPDIQRSRIPRRSPRLRINEQEEDDDGEKNTDTDFATRAPIIGYEVVDQRQKFTVYKIQVRTGCKKWFVFRRYTDFTRLNDKLRDAYPNFRIRLPGKRWFKDNFDPEFIEERARGLQFFINNLLQHSEISESPEIHEFFCLNDPPGPYDSLEESRAYCQHLENQAEDLRQKVDELTAELEMTKSQLIQARVQQEALVGALQSERTLRKRESGEKTSNSALVEEIIAENEKRTRSNSLRGRFSPLLPQPRRRTISKGKMMIVGDVIKDDKNLWEGSIEITEHSSGACADKMRPFKLARRNSEERRTHGPHTSTPIHTSTPSSDLNGMEPKPASHLEESLHDGRKTLKGCEENGKTNAVLDLSGVLPIEASKEDLKEKYDHRQVIRKVSGEQPGKHSSKRDSGISIDNSPTQST